EVVEALKAGDISLNAAAAVASLPEEEQKSAALAGKDELKQAAKRVREARRKPPVEKDGDTQLEAPPAPGDETAALHQRVQELQAENAALREQVASLQAQLDTALAA